MNSNKLTGKPYNGKNQAELENARINNEYKSEEWVTFLQAKELGLKIKKGSKGVSIFKGFTLICEEDKEGKKKQSSMPLGFARVFNLDCTEKF